MRSSPSIQSAAIRLCCLAGLLLRGGMVHGQDDDAPKWMQHLRVGASGLFNVKASFSDSGTFTLPQGATGATGTPGVDHVYDDGYVKVDATGNAQGYTSFWGYQSASQYDAGSQTLTFHSATSYTGSSSSDKNAGPFVGVEAAYGTDLFNWDTVHLGWEVGAGLTPILIHDSLSTPVTVNQSLFSFNTGGIVMPTAPYNGGSSGLGPTIHDVATAQGNVVSAGTITGTRSLDVVLYTAKLGPTLYWDATRYVGFRAAGGPVVGLVSGNYKFDEKITSAGGAVASSAGEIGMSKAVYGGYVEGAVLVHLIDNGDIYLSGQFMPLGSTSVSGGGRSAKLDLSGAYQIAAGFSWPF